jgi:periplasmic protein TonB
MAGPLSLTVDASARPASWRGRALGLFASLGLQTSAILALGVAPLVSFDDLPSPQRSESAMVLHVINVPRLPPALPPSRGPAPRNAAQRVPAGIVPPRFPDEIPLETEGPIEDPGFDVGVPAGAFDGVPYGDPGAAGDGWVPAPVVPPAPTGPVPVGGDITPPRKRIHVSPVYPAIALQAHVQGTVVLEANIDEAGNVVNLRVLHSVTLLDSAAVDAVSRWKYEPTYLNGRAVPVVMSVNVDFRIAR